MGNANAEPMLFFFFCYIVLLWAFSTTIIADKTWRYIPLSIIGITLALAYIYIIEKNVDANTVDRKFFKQSTLLFFTSCLVTATEYKKNWRNADRNIKDVAEDPERELMDKQQYENRTAYLTELMVLDDWACFLGTYKHKLGFIGFWESMSKRVEKVKRQAILPNPMSPDNINRVQESQANLAHGMDAPDKSESNINLKEDVAPPQQIILDGPPKYVSTTGDMKLETLERNLRNYVDKPTKVGELIDTWLEAMECARDEDYFEKKYWAFLHGYLNLKMTQLLEN